MTNIGEGGGLFCRAFNSQPRFVKMGQNANFFLYVARMNGNLYSKILVQSENTCVIRSKIYLEAL